LIVSGRLRQLRVTSTTLRQTNFAAETLLIKVLHINEFSVVGLEATLDLLLVELSDLRLSYYSRLINLREVETVIL